MNRALLTVRALLFYIGYILLTLWFGVTGLFFAVAPYAVRRRYILGWNRCTVAWLKVTCSVAYSVNGIENLPQGPVVVLSKHNSQWETFYLQLLFQPLATIMKRELLNIPAFGWGLRLLKPIAIDRGNPRDAMRQMLDQGSDRLGEGLSVLVFPEGTRTPEGIEPRYARGGAALAIRAGVPMVPVAHNAGMFWPPHRLWKYPGTIQVSIGPAINAGGSSAKELTEQAREWIEGEVARIQQD